MIRLSATWRVLSFTALFGLLTPGLLYAQTPSQYFPETGQSVSGRFLSFWRDEGGLAVFGYPITPQGDEPNRDTGQTYPTQWFERNRFELHPENAAPYDVLLGRLGDDALQQQGRDWRAEGRESGPQPGCLWFEQTGHNVCNQANGLGFRTYWETNGLNDPRLDPFARSLALFGLPLTAPREETNSSGDRVLTQWFERARFEWHPNEPDQFKVLLGRLGAEINGADAPPLPPHRGSRVNFSTPSQGENGLFQSVGSYGNAQGQIFSITVTSQSDAAIQQFAGQASFDLSAQAARNTQPVLAFYYPWYDLADWDQHRDQLSDTPSPKYDGGDSLAMQRHIDQAQGAGINGFICAWLGKADPTNDRCAQLLSLAADRGFGITFSPDQQVNGQLNSPDAMIENLAYLRDTYMRDPAWLRWNDKPVLVFFNVSTLTAADWQKVQQSVDPGRQWFWLGEGTDVSYLDVFDGLYVYDITNPPRSPAQAMQSYADRLNGYNQARGTNKPFIATVMPGYDDRKVAAGSPSHVQDRADGDFYRQSWAAANAYNPSMYILTSFNEFYEGSYIEPSERFGDYYLRLTQETLVGLPPTVMEDSLRANGVNLSIDIKLMPDQADNFTEGYQVNLDIDPPIGQGITHTYNQLCTNSAFATIEANVGEVNASLFRDNVRLQNRIIAAGKRKTVSNQFVGGRTYGLSVRGNTNQNRYRIYGSWSTSFYDPAPAGNSCQ